MEQIKHTPGPWAAKLNHTNPQTHTVSGAGWDEFATVITRMTGDTEDEPSGLANLRLIAAAPDLLESCRALLAVFGNSYATKTPVPLNCPAATHAHEAISKAIGA